MANCEVGATRHKLSFTRETAYGDNLSLVAEGIGYRKEIATLLGYPSWAHYVTETRMSGSPEVRMALARSCFREQLILIAFTSRFDSLMDTLPVCMSETPNTTGGG